jgi:hypothetical protein
VSECEHIDKILLTYNELVEEKSEELITQVREEVDRKEKIF